MSSEPVFSCLDWMVVAGILHAHNVGGAAGIQYWPSRALLATILHDSAANSLSLHDIRADLAEVGLTLRAWLIDHNERLYNYRGRETFEPVLHRVFLKRIYDAMFALSRGTFGFSRFSFEELAAQAREPNVDRVRRAVRRLAITTRSVDLGHINQEAIWSGKSSWSMTLTPAAAKRVLERIADLDHPSIHE